MTDIKYNFWVNPLRPAFRHQPLPSAFAPIPLQWPRFNGEIVPIGYTGAGFTFDNERPCHQVLLGPFRLASRLVTNGEFLEFIGDGGCRRPDLWLSAGWAATEAQEWRSPLYWERINGEWQAFTLSGMRPLDLSGPVCHVSYYEADAFARWAGKRLPTEQEWEHAADSQPAAGNFVESSALHPLPGRRAANLHPVQSAMFGNGPPAHTCPIPASDPPRGRWANTTANS